MSFTTPEVQSAIEAAQAKAEAAAAQAFLIAFTEALVNTVSALPDEDEDTDIEDADVVEDEPTITTELEVGDRVRVSEDAYYTTHDRSQHRDGATAKVSGKVVTIREGLDSCGDYWVKSDDGTTSYINASCVSIEPPVEPGDEVKVIAERPYWRDTEGLRQFHDAFPDTMGHRPKLGDTGTATDEGFFGDARNCVGLNGYMIAVECLERVEA